MSPFVLGALVLLLVTASVAWVARRPAPWAWGSAVGLAVVLAAAFVGSPWLPAWPQLEPWGVLAGVALATVGGGPVASAMLALVKKTADADAQRELELEYSSAELAAMASALRTPAAPTPQLRGGKWIGLLERLAVAGSVAAGYPAGVAVVLAVKGLGRYPELQAGNAERFIIGTFVSLLWALGACGVALVA